MDFRFVIAVLAGGLATSMTDWFFMGDWIYKRFDKHPEIWRFEKGQGESKGIAWSVALPFLTCAVFDFLCIRQRPFTPSSTFTLAIGAWMGVALPLIAANAIWMKISAPIAAFFSMGWLVKLLVAGLLLVVIER
ncbi:MAG: hypothetical protein JO041_09935 [Acidobacteria bacterium]|nr:hypothetical protein [Acidobacteriota bacterium]